MTGAFAIFSTSLREENIPFGCKVRALFGSEVERVGNILLFWKVPCAAL
jgi:hypothetical protein